MMTKLCNHVAMMTAEELAEARKNHGPYFHSPHEGYGVIGEELEEATDECEETQKYFSGLLYSIRVDDHARLTVDLDRLERHAQLAACEFIQVAAMARKMRDSLGRVAR